MNDQASTLDRLVAKAQQLYSLPAVAVKVLELTGNPQVDTRALKQCIENDPALTTKVLRVVNSSLFGLSREVSDLNQALALLGIKPLKLLVLGFSLPEGLFAGVEAEILQRYWRHTLTKAVAAREISETVWRRPGDDPFIAGLLQDLGMLLLMQELGRPYLQFLDKVHADGKDLMTLQIEAMGFDHTTLTARLLEHWGLPEGLVAAVRWGTARTADAASSPQQRSLPQIIHMAELAARLLADERPEVLGELLTVGKAYGKVSREQLEEMLGRLEEKVRQLADVLSLDLPDGLEYRDILVQAHVQLSDVATETAGDLLRGSGTSPGRAEGEPEALLDQMQALSQAVAQVCQSAEQQADPGQIDSSAARSAKSPPADAPGVITTDRGGSSSPRGTLSVAAGADPGLLGKLGTAVAACRQARRPLSLLLVETEDVDEVVISRGVEGLEQVRQLLADACRGLDHRCQICLAYGEAGFAVILPDCDRQQAVRLGYQVLGRVGRTELGRPSGGGQVLNVGVGAATVAMPSKNFPPEDLLDRAGNCLYGSHSASGGVVKSIEIY